MFLRKWSMAVNPVEARPGYHGVTLNSVNSPLQNHYGWIRILKPTAMVR